jgi:Zn-finger in Ran binding protein and others
MTYGGYGYGAPHMMGPHHHMGHHGGHGMGHGGRMGGGGGGMVPFRAGDWKCGNEGCGYHNFAKNVSCLRCNASRAGAAVVADSSFTAPMEPPSGYGMGPPGPMGGNAGPNPFGPPHGGYGSGAFGAGSGYGGHNAYTNMGNPPGAWPPMGGPMHPPSSASHSGGFDSRATEAAFSSGGNTPQTSQSGGPSYGSTYGSIDNSADPFAFLNAGMGALGMSDEPRRNGANTSKSPTS